MVSSEPDMGQNMCERDDMCDRGVTNATPMMLTTWRMAFRT
jgi:hypothetical protein